MEKKDGLKKHSNKNPQISIFIDGSNIFRAGVNLYGKKIPPENLVNILSKNKNIINTYYFSSEDRANARQVRFHENLNKKHQINVFTEPLAYKQKIINCRNCNHQILPGKCPKCFYDNILKPETSKRIDVLLAVTMLDKMNEFNEAILVTGDADFIPLIRKLKYEKGKKILLASFKDSLANDYVNPDSETGKKVVDDIILLDNYKKQLLK